MGCMCSSSPDPTPTSFASPFIDAKHGSISSFDSLEVERESLQQKRSIVLGKGRTNARLGLVMLQANKAATLISTGNMFDEELEYELSQRLIRKAKNEGSTVSIVDGILYIDYKFIGYLPPHIK